MATPTCRSYAVLMAGNADYEPVAMAPGDDMDLLTLNNDELRRAIRTHQVSFPAEAPVFPKQTRADIGWRVALLYFVRCWSLSEIAQRYRLSRERAGQIVKVWRTLAVQSGYIQEIPDDPFLRASGD